jgi:hypothetical protein
MSENKAVNRPLFREVRFDRAGDTQSRFHRGWHEPVLDLFKEARVFPPKVPTVPKLYLVPTPDNFEGEETDPTFARKPSPLSELPALDEWVAKYVVSIVEILNGKRPIQQISRWTHRITYQRIVNEIHNISTWRPQPKIRKFYISQPLEGIAEVTVTLRFENQIRAMLLRFEGVERRWVCTQLELI